MPEKYLEENRYLYIESKLGPNELLLESFTGSEGISQLFCFQLELLSENKRIKFEDILGQEISFGVAGPEEGEPPRCIHGIVTAFAQLAGHQPSLQISRRRVAETLDFDSEAELPDFPKPLRSRYPQKGARGIGRRVGTAGLLPTPRILRTVPRNGLQLRVPAHGRGRHLLFFPVREGRAQAGHFRYQGVAPRYAGRAIADL